MSYDKELQEVISFLKEQKIFIDFDEFKFQIETHPDYPSLLAFSDALFFYDVPNIALKLSIEDVDQLPNSYVALLGSDNEVPSLYHVVRDHGLFCYKRNKELIKSNKEEFSNVWKDVVLLVEKPENIEVKSKSQYESLLFFGFSIFILGLTYFFSHSILSLIFTGLSILGIYLSIEALKTELGIQSKVSQTFCNAIVNTDCSQVINSNKNKWLIKIKISDISIWFFISQIFIIFMFTIIGNTQMLLSYMFVVFTIAIPMTFYSIYFQYKIEKKWCPICLLIITVFYMQFILLCFIRKNIYFDISSVLLFLFSYFLIAALVYIFKPIFLTQKEAKENYIKQLMFSRNYEVFKNTLLKSNIIFFEKENIVLGNPNALKKISVVTSPMCGYCKAVHEMLERILKKYPDQIAVNIRFNFYNNTEDRLQNLLLRLTEIYRDSGDLSFMEALDNWFVNKNFDNWFLKYGKTKNVDSIQFQLEEITKENAERGVAFTPDIFLNEFNFPRAYDRNNLEYFIADWIDDEDIS